MAGACKAVPPRLAQAGCAAHETAAVTGHETLSKAQRYTVAADQPRMAAAALGRIGKPETGVAKTTPQRVVNKDPSD